VPLAKKGESSDLLRNRIGGKAVLPIGTSWPTFTLEHWLGEKAKRREFPGAYVGTYDLRGCFAFKRFPAAVSIFLCTYNEYLNKYGSYADPGCPVGNVIPLYSGEQLALVGAPEKELESPLAGVAVWDLPDFPPMEASLDEVVQSTPTSAPRRARIERVYEAIDAVEPGTSRWIHIQGDKIGGYDSFIQWSLAAELNRSRPNQRWRLVATYAGDEIALGDAGILYILAGWDAKAKKWRWHCEWQCH
jgi:hypothetical protein